MWRILLVFLVPLMLSNVLQSASQTMASIWIGRLISTQALGADLGGLPDHLSCCSRSSSAFRAAAACLIGQAFGAHDHHKVKKIAGTVLGAALYLGIIVAIVGALGSTTMLAWLGTPPDIIAQADAYARVIFLTMPVFFVYFVYATILRGTGDSTTPFYALIVSAVLAIAITPLFIVGTFGLPKLGVVSAAVSGVIANSAALAWLLYYLHKRNHPLKFDRETLSDMRIDWTILRAVVRIGVPTGIQVMMVSLAEIAVISFVNRFGSSATAAYGAVNQVVGYVQFPAISIGIAASIFGAQCIGARREDKLGSVIRSAVGLNYAIGGGHHRPVLRLRVADSGLVHHRRPHAAHRPRAADDHALGIRDLRQLGRAQRRDARQRNRALADDHRHLRDLGRRGARGLLIDAPHRPRRRVARLPDRLLRGPHAPVLLLRVRLEAQDPRTPRVGA